MLIMDNALFHHSERVKDMCSNAGVKLVYLPPYSPDLNPIEEFFSEPKRPLKESFEITLDPASEISLNGALMSLVQERK